MTRDRCFRLYADHRSDWKEVADMSYLKMSDLQFPDLSNHQGNTQLKASLSERLVRQATYIAPLRPYTLAAFPPWGILQELVV